MSNRVPLVIDSSTNRIVELPVYDNLDLTNSNISNVSNINSAGNVTASYFIGNGSALTGVTAVASPAGSNTEIQYNNAGSLGANANFTINTATGVLSATNFSGNGSALTSLTAANIVGTVANANYANIAGTAYSVDGANVTGTVANATYATSAGSATTAGTVTTNAQPNITSVGTLTTLTVSGNLVPTNVVLDKFNETVVNGGNTGAATLTPDASAGTIFNYTLTGNITINALANAVAGTSVTLILKQDATGSRLLTSTMKFAGGSKTLSTAANSIDILGIFYDGTTYYASLTKGYA